MAIKREYILWAIVVVVCLLLYTWWASRPKDLMQGSDDLIRRLGALGGAAAVGYGNTGIMPPSLPTGNVPA